MQHNIVWLLFGLVLAFPTVLALDMSITTTAANNEVAPGNVITIPFQIVNGASVLTDVTFKLDEGRSFSVDGDEEITYAVMTPHQIIPLSYTLRADTTAKTGYHTIMLRASAANDTLEKSFTLLVKDFEPQLSVTAFESVPEQLTPGKEGTLSLTLTNKASYQLKNILAKLDLTTVPFAPLHSVGEKSVEKIRAGETTTVTFTLAPLGNAETGIYKIPLSITFVDEFGKPGTVATTVTLIVGTAPTLTGQVDENSLVVNRASKITIKIVNSGESAVKFLQAQLVPGNYQVLSVNPVYVGDVDSDDYETVEFTLLSPQTSVPLPLLLTYKDANHQSYAQPVILTANAHTVAEAKERGLVKQGNAMYVIGGVLVLLILFIIIMVRRKNRKKNDH